MKTALTALVCVLAVTAPALLPGETSGTWSANVAHAQDNVTKMAREKFLEGVKAYDAGRYEEARIHFLQAYSLKRHPAVLLNLGQSELKSNHVEDGGNHLQQFLRESNDATDDQKKAARDGVADAQRKTAFVILIVDADGSDLSIDGKTIGKSPLPDPYFVTPGAHKATANYRGKKETVDFEGKRGTAVPVSITLGVQGSVAPAPGPVPSPDPTPAPPPSGVTPGPAPIGPAPAPGAGFGPPPDTGPDVSRKGFIEWYKERPAAWALTAAAGLGLGFTVGFGIAAGIANSNAGSIEDQINTELAKPGSPLGEGDQPCGPRDDPGIDPDTKISPKDHPHYAEACGSLRQNLEAYDDDIMGVAIAGAITGAVVIAFVVYYIVDSKNSSSGRRTPPLLVAPVVSPTEGGLGVVGQF